MMDSLPTRDHGALAWFSYASTGAGKLYVYKHTYTRINNMYKDVEFGLWERYGREVVLPFRFNWWFYPSERASREGFSLCLLTDLPLFGHTISLSGLMGLLLFYSNDGIVAQVVRGKIYAYRINVEKPSLTRAYKKIFPRLALIPTLQTVFFYQLRLSSTSCIQGVRNMVYTLWE